MNNILKVKDQIKFVIKYNEWANGIETSAGLYQAEELEELEETQGWSVFGITYDSTHATELPADWPDIEVLDDNDKRQKIKQIHWSRKDKRYEMEDGTFSEAITL